MPRVCSEFRRKQLIKQKGTVCYNCHKNEENNIMFHHIIPVAIGGTENDSNIVPLCQDCHNKLHTIENKNNTLSHSALIKRGLEKAKKNGVQIGRIPITVNDLPIEFKEKYYPLIKSKKITITKASQMLNMSRTTIYKYVYLLDEYNNTIEENGLI